MTRGPHTGLAAATLALVTTLVAIALYGAAMLTNTTWAKRRHARELVADVHAPDRYVDLGVTLATVVADPNGEALIPGKPKLRIVRSRTLGGVVDTRIAQPRLVGPTRAPQRWYCSVDQEPVILHADGDPLGQLVYGSEGAGKTTALAMWLYVRWLEHLGLGLEMGVTAPTEVRLGLVLREVTRLWPGAWYQLRAADNILELCDRTRVRAVSTYQQSAAQGSRIQGFNWCAAARDEAQDSVEQHADIEQRGREAPNGRYKQLATCTAKDDPAFRDLRDQLEAARDPDGNRLWVRRTLYGKASPFVDPSFWAAKAASMPVREYQRRVEARDVGPERATYPTWSREHNVIAIPEIGWQDITADELRAYGANSTLLVGHDPGNTCDVSLILKAYRVPGVRSVRWIVLDELTTEQSTTDAHIRQLLTLVRERWRANLRDRLDRPVEGGPQMLVRADPAGNNDNRTDRTVYTQFRNYGIAIKPAAYTANGTAHGRVPREPGIEMVNTLLCSATGERRLFVARKPDGTPAAPKLVAAIEGSERDLAGKAETQRKGRGDLSHWPAALRYALWALERPRLQIVTPTASEA